MNGDGALIKNNVGREQLTAGIFIEILVGPTITGKTQ